MSKTIIVTVTASNVPPALNSDAPDGIHIIVPPIPRTKGFGIEVAINIDLKIVVDLGLISSAAAAIWIVQKVRRARIDVQPKVDQKALPTNEQEAVKMVKDAIDEKTDR